jgi:hypothetical protein
MKRPRPARAAFSSFQACFLEAMPRTPPRDVTVAPTGAALPPVFTALPELAGNLPSQVRFDSADIVLYYCFT